MGYCINWRNVFVFSSYLMGCESFELVEVKT